VMKERVKVTITESQLQDNVQYRKRGDETDQTMCGPKNGSWLVDIL